MTARLWLPLAASVPGLGAGEPVRGEEGEGGTGELRERDRPLG